MIVEDHKSLSYLKAGLVTGAKADADATHAAMQKAVFMVFVGVKRVLQGQNCKPLMVMIVRE
jgi:hypothetical protein